MNFSQDDLLTRTGWRGQTFLWLLLCVTLSTRSALSATFDIDTSGIPDPSTYLNGVVASGLVKSIGLAMDYRAFEPATPLGTALGIDFGIETTLAKPPSDLGTSLGTLTGGGSAVEVPILPSVRFHFHKGIGQFVDLGLSYLPAISAIPIIGKSYFFGVDLKWCFFHPDEGPSAAFRISYNINSLNAEYSPASITINTTTISPQLILSKKLGFADPYIGIGFQYAYGNVGATITLPTLPAPAPIIPTFTVTDTGSGSGGVFFCGISLKVPNVGIRLTLEGAYSTAQVNYLGTKFGFSF